MHRDIGSQLLADAAFVYNQQRRLAEAAAQQIDDAQFFQVADRESNSVAVIMKHVGGNLRSRWTEFLTSDGEKPDRNRDGEFITEGENRSDVMRTWNEGWQRLEDTLASLTSADLQRSVTVRGEPQTVIQALLRNLSHASHHAGQIVLLAKSMAGAEWRTLSIPRGDSSRVAGNFWVARNA
ncbi:MAG: DinB family protein [Pseudomonas sp.]